MTLIKIKDVNIYDLDEVRELNLFDFEVLNKYDKNPKLAYDSANYDIFIGITAGLSVDMIKTIAIFIYNQLKNRKKNRIEIDNKVIEIEPVSVESITNLLKEIREKDKKNKL